MNSIIEKATNQNKISGIKKIEDYLELLSDSERTEIIEKMKKYYSKYINELDNTRNFMSLSYKIKNKYNKNNSSSVNKSLVTNAPRTMEKKMQELYQEEVKEVISFLIENLENTSMFPDFESIILYAAKKRRLIELYKLNIGIFGNNEKRRPFFMYFGKFRGVSTKNIQLNFESPVIDSKGAHLVNYITQNYRNYPLRYKDYYLTFVNFPDEKKNHLRWHHTIDTLIYNLLKEMNKLFETFKSSLSNRNRNENKEKSKKLLSELYWLYMQACPFLRGSASIGEIVFSALLQKYFGCDFRLFREPFNPMLIPDIHALTYELGHFQLIFWDQFVSC
jgi:hypothetical protein